MIMHFPDTLYSGNRFKAKRYERWSISFMRNILLCSFYVTSCMRFSIKCISYRKRIYKQNRLQHVLHTMYAIRAEMTNLRYFIFSPSIDYFSTCIILCILIVFYNLTLSTNVSSLWSFHTIRFKNIKICIYASD